MGIVMTETTEEIVRVVTAYESGQHPSSIVVVVPRECQVKRGQKFLVKRGKKGRLIYEPIPAGEAETKP